MKILESFLIFINKNFMQFIFIIIIYSFSEEKLKKKIRKGYLGFITNLGNKFLALTE